MSPISVALPIRAGRSTAGLKGLDFPSGCFALLIKWMQFRSAPIAHKRGTRVSDGSSSDVHIRTFPCGAFCPVRPHSTGRDRGRKGESDRMQRDFFWAAQGCPAGPRVAAFSKQQKRRLAHDGAASPLMANACRRRARNCSRARSAADDA